jgi:PPOX class probable F420-dependent enzyme
MTPDQPRPFGRLRTIALTTFKRDGAAVTTPVNIVVDGDRAFIRTWSTSGKAKRLRHTSRARMAPSTGRGRPTGPAVDIDVQPAAPKDVELARHLFRRKYPLLQGVFVPLAHRLRRYETVHYEVR